MTRTQYTWTDSASWNADPTTGDDDLADDNTYSTCPKCGPRAVFRLTPFWTCVTCGSWPVIDSDISRPIDRARKGTA